MYEALLPILVAVALVAALYYFVRKGMTLFINAVSGLIILFIVNTFHLLAFVDTPDIPVTWAAILICAFGGIPGAVILILLAIAGITI
ncbi:MAG: pro-sigmaK processing inhibitor BofA family protein [Methanocalculus sp.]|uniref:pro-sigmaK processing inhibitor BofA family protein n=1 Tax=Methanocalculus sp. TaxID=2004547 RepID=UPI0027179FA1|nr:pro-sigmaK processing inhibitor BofA family protein [Methanocalculus sp.]MDO9540051.1 pro-sigmaK processing inhibitor BofA family protein [Methanocalculus sp.]